MASKDDTTVKWFRFQRLLAERTSRYLQDVGQLIGEGSVEPRAYVERSTKFWGDVIGEVGDFLSVTEAALPVPKALPGPRELKVIAGTLQQRVQSRPIPLDISVEDIDIDDQQELFLSVDSLSRQSKAGVRRPRVSLQPDVHFRVYPERVTRSSRRGVELKIFNLPDNLVTGDVYSGTLYGAPSPKGEEKRLKPGSGRALATIELTVA